MNERILAVQRMQDYIETHIAEDITLAELAQVSYFSPWYSHRMFKEYTGLAPNEYVRRLRLSNSAMRLRDEKVKIIDVALDMGFKSPDGYTKAFQKEFGCTPKKYALHNVPLSLFIPYGAKFVALYKKESNKMSDVKNVFIQVVDKPARKVIVKRGKSADNYMDYCEEVGCDVWGILVSMKSLCGEPVCLWLPRKYIKPNTSSYVQGVEVPCDYTGEVPDGFDIIDLPAAKYLMFQGEPFAQEDYCDAIVAVQQSAEKYNPDVLGYVWDDENPTIQLEPIGERGYIELYPVKQK